MQRSKCFCLTDYEWKRLILRFWRKTLDLCNKRTYKFNYTLTIYFLTNIQYWQLSQFSKNFLKIVAMVAVSAKIMVCEIATVMVTATFVVIFCAVCARCSCDMIENYRNKVAILYRICNVFNDYILQHYFW